MNSNKIKHILTITFLALICFSFSGILIFAPKKDYSMTERRTLKKVPAPNWQNLSSGKFMSDFDDFVLDQFPLRDNFRSLKAVFSKYALFQKDNNGLYLYKGWLSKLEYPENPEKIGRQISKLNSIYKTYLENSNCKIYLSIIPDKNYFLAPKAKFPVMNYDYLLETVQNKLSYAEFIDIFPQVSLESFYKTDQHWKQEKILPVADTLLQVMVNQKVSTFEFLQLENPFYGTYVGQAALSVKPDSILYGVNPDFTQVQVTSYNSGSPSPALLYDMNKAQGRDPYEMFLGGSDPLITIENPNVQEQKELIIFRDSFGSSITPLLIPAYSKITLVDLRYIQPSLLKNYLDFDSQDVLFLYSTLILNS